MLTQQGVFKDYVHRFKAFIGQAEDEIINLGQYPKSNFTLVVSPNSNTPTIWNVQLMGSLDAVHWTVLVNHKNGTNAIGSLVMTNGGPVSFIKLINSGATAQAVTAEVLGN